ncbi:MAG: PEP-CTERM sorting domain-containing protein [Kiritimatiellae bacterium]|nr:PEP-CTERM sorting domain-containing protein [Kiritimatiellia bacterium]
MKKLMFVLAAVLAAGMVQAASINWGTGTGIKGVTSDSDPSFGSANAASGTLNVYVWLVDAATYNSTGVDKIWDTYGSSLGTATASVTGKSGAAGATAKTDGLSFSATEDTPYYGLVLTTYDPDKDGTVDYYIANKAVGNVNTSGNGGAIGNLAKSLGGTGGTAISGWTSASSVPEPTSGILLLLGMAGLALRRKHA